MFEFGDMMGGIARWERIFVIVVFLFGFGSILGWCLEVLFRRFISDTNPERKWINPGFLVGPCLPIYGFGNVALFGLSLVPSIGNGVWVEPTWQRVVVSIIIMGVMMTLIEYIAGIIFIKRMNIKLWDYSGNRGNIQGIICPLFSFLWTVLGAVYYFLIQPYIVKMVLWLYDNVGFIFFIGIYFGVLLTDLAYSFNVAGKLKAYAKENAIIIRYEELKENIRKYNEDHNIASKFFGTFVSNISIKEHLDAYKERLVGIKNTVASDLSEVKNAVASDLSEVKQAVANEITEIKEKVDKH